MLYIYSSVLPVTRMNTWRLVTYLFLLNFLFQSCNQENAFDCVKSTGSLSQEERPVQAFHTILLADNIDLYLYNHTPGKAVVEAGKNLLPKIDFSYKGDTLIISNKNSCEWVRSYKHPVSVTMGIPTENLTLIHQGYGKIIAHDMLQVSSLSIFSLDAGGEIDLQMRSGSVSLYSNTHALIKLKGQATNAFIWLNKSIGRVYAESLQTQYSAVKHGGSNEIRIFPLKELLVEILQNGNVAYYNEPEKLTTSITGTGKLIKR